VGRSVQRGVIGCPEPPIASEIVRHNTG
jgi:hypothetical protein